MSYWQALKEVCADLAAFALLVLSVFLGAVAMFGPIWIAYFLLGNGAFGLPVSAVVAVLILAFVRWRGRDGGISY